MAAVLAGRAAPPGGGKSPPWPPKGVSQLGSGPSLTQEGQGDPVFFHAHAGLQASMNDFLITLKTARYAESPRDEWRIARADIPVRAPAVAPPFRGAANRR